MKRDLADRAPYGTEAGEPLLRVQQDGTTSGAAGPHPPEAHEPNARDVEEPLGAYGLRVRTVRLLAGGNMTRVWLVAAEEGRFVLRRLAAGSEQQARTRHHLLRFLSGRLEGVPAPVAASNGDTVVHPKGAPNATTPSSRTRRGTRGDCSGTRTVASRPSSPLPSRKQGGTDSFRHSA